MEPLNFSSRPLWLVYIGRMLILTGMVLVFGGIGATLSNYLCKWFFDVNIFGLDISAIDPENSNVVHALQLFQTLSGGIGLFLIPAFLFPQVIHYTVDSMLMVTFKPGWKQLVLALVAILVSVPLISGLYQLNLGIRFPEFLKDWETGLRAMEKQAEQLTKIFVHADSTSDLFLNLFVVALVPAICEEFFFRGILLQYTRFISGSTWLSIIVSAVVFSAFHGQFFGFLPRLVLGIMLGYMFMNSGSIWVPVAAHFLNNAMAVLVVYFEKDLSALAVFQETYQFAWYWVILSGGLAWVSCWYLRQTFIRKLYTNLPGRKKRP